MISRTVFEDKLPEDKVKYYNRTRMSLDLFCKTVGLAQMVLLKELAAHGYRYNECSRQFEKTAVLENPRFARR